MSRLRPAACAAGVALVGLLVARPAAAQSLFFTGGPGVASPPVEYQGPDAVRVHIEGNGSLFQESTNGWQPVCQVPCTTLVSPRGNYKLGGFMEKDSAPFRFPPGPQLDLVAHTESALDIERSVWGWMAIGFAAAPAVLGTLVLTGTFESSGTPQSIDRFGGGALIAGGVALLATGIYLLADAPQTTLTTTDGQRVATAWPRLRLTPGGVTF